MKTIISHITILILLLLAFSSCTHNNGDIGIWFGTWHVESITTDGTPANVDGDYFFQFQNKVLRVSKVGSHEQTIESFGTWNEDESGKMNISFPDPTTFYIAMPGLETHNDFTVTTTSSHEVTFTKADATGITYSYHLKKQP